MEHGGDFGLDKIAYFNGGLFDGRRALRLDSGDVGLLQAAAGLDWSQIDPTIFGTLFERFLDPDKRSQIGAHYTDPEKIMMQSLVLGLLKAESQIFSVPVVARVRVKGFNGSECEFLRQLGEHLALVVHQMQLRLPERAAHAEMYR